MTDLCECGCDEPVKPGNRFVFTHHARTVRGLRYEERAAALSSPRAPCQCGCGELAGPGKRYLLGHYSRSLRRDSPTEHRNARCPRCQNVLRLRADGTFGVHWMSQKKSDYRRRCPEGGMPAPLRRPRPGRRVTASIDVVLPDGWDLPRFKAEAAAVLRAHLDEPFVVALDAEEAS